MDDVRISSEDQERIDAMVRQYRSQVENLYRIAYLQGAIDQSTEDRDKLRASAARVTVEQEDA